MPIETALTFILASALLAFAPGPDNIFVLTQSATHGWRAGVLVTLGLCTGLIVHTMAVALGVAAIFQVSAVAFTGLKILGAVYLLYLAWQAFKAGAMSMDEQKSAPLSAKALYWRGVVMNITNPKVAIFFLAFLPQFTQVGGLPISLQMVILGLLFIATALVVFSTIAVLSGLLRHWFARSQSSQAWLNRVASVVFVGLAIKLLTSQRA
jgi:threonine/homoserine/homoserine lactone efflux protein